MRIATQNFNKKLYGAETNILSIIKLMKDKNINILVGQEPGHPSRFNVTRLINQARKHGYDVKLISRHQNSSHGGIIAILDKQWSKIPCKMREFRPDKEELRGRLMSLEFDNKEQGHHNKLQIVVAHLLNAAHTREEDTARLLTWAASEKDRFNTKYPKAPSILLGDLNAAQTTALDTDKQTLAQETEGTEQDAAVLKTIRDMMQRLLLLLLLFLYDIRFPHRPTPHSSLA